VPEQLGSSEPTPARTSEKHCRLHHDPRDFLAGGDDASRGEEEMNDQLTRWQEFWWRLGTLLFLMSTSYVLGRLLHDPTLDTLEMFFIAVVAIMPLPKKNRP
jgi:hypothetical protein